MIQGTALASGSFEAAIWRRLVAALIDSGIGFIVVFAVLFALALAGAHDLARLGATVLMVAYWWVFCPYMESSRYQATWGKLLLGVRVTDRAGNPLSFGRALIRNLARGLVLMAPFVVLAVAVDLFLVTLPTAGKWIALLAIAVALVFMLLPSGKQTPWDGLTRTRVLSTGGDIP